MTGSLINEIIKYSQDYPFDVDCTKLLEAWKEGKKSFVEKFNGETRIRSSEYIRTFLSEEQQDKDFKKFLDTLIEYGILSDNLKHFLIKNKKGFFDNRVVVPSPRYNIHAGDKLSRSFRKFILDPYDLKFAQNLASTLIQENKVEGYLYLSVDPIDFLTLSETNAKWRSCHSLDGGFRAGDLNYMVDDTTFIAYLASPKQEKLKCFPEGITWNSKKWRMLLHTNGNCIYYNKQYPFKSENLLKATYNEVSKIFPGFSFPEQVGEKREVHDTLLPTKYNKVRTGEGFVRYKDDVIDTSDFFGYSDIAHSPSFIPIVSVAERKKIVYNKSSKKEVKDLLRIKIGKPAPCVCCGQEPIGRDSSFLCSDCRVLHNADEDFFISCYDCERRLYPEDEIIWKDDLPYCTSCAEY